MAKGFAVDRLLDGFMRVFRSDLGGFRGAPASSHQTHVCCELKVLAACVGFLFRCYSGPYYGDGSGFGGDLVRDLSRLIERVHDGEGGKRTPSAG